MNGPLLAALGLASAGRAAELSAGKLSFSAVHLGTKDVPIGAVLDLIHRDPGLLPPRTGHLGNWEDITLGRSGPMDFNTAVCGAGHGYPLIYGFTRTEADSPGGDEAYQPGSLINGGNRRLLPLHTWDGRRFTERDRSRPLFCPMVQTDTGGGLTPLVDVHWQRMLSLTGGYRFRQWATSLLDNTPLLTQMLGILLEAARADPNPHRALGEVISHAARLDGAVDRCDLVPDGTHGYLLDGHRFSSTEALVDAVLLPLRALTEPRRFFDGMSGHPPVLPVISLLLTNVLFALLGDHRPDEKGIPAEDPFITHLHWGARAMAGCPPRRNGYFTRRSRMRPMRDLTATLVKHLPQARPVCFLLLPAQTFMLCPPDTSPTDTEAMSALFRAVRAAAPDAAHETARAAIDKEGAGFSDYLRDRFRDGTGVPSGTAVREPAVPTEPEGFRDLTFRQASAVVAAFEDAVSTGKAQP